jgi:hypothetical protein
MTLQLKNVKIPTGIAALQHIKNWTHTPTEMPQYPMLDACLAHLTDSFVIIYQALANPKKSQELMAFMKEIVHTETSALMRKHNDVQRDELSIGLWGMKFVLETQAHAFFGDRRIRAAGAGTEFFHIGEEEAKGGACVNAREVHTVMTAKPYFNGNTS